MKSIGLLTALTVFLAGCTLVRGASSPIPTAATIRPTDETRTTTPSLPPTEAAMSAADLESIIQSINQELSSEHTLKATPDGSYAITGRDGSAVKNILLHTDGNFYVTEQDGSQTILPAETVFIPKSDYWKGVVFAGLDQISIATGTVSEIPITQWPSDPENELPRITSDMLPQYELLVRRQLEEPGYLDRAFAGSDTTITWTLTQETWGGDFDMNGDGTQDKYSGLQLHTYEDEHDIEWSKIPLRIVFTFARIMDMDGLAIFGAFIKNADPTIEEYSLFPLATDTTRITAADTSHNKPMLEWLDPEKAGISKQEINGKAIRWLVVPDAYLLQEANVDFQGGKIVAEYFVQGVDPVADQAREDIILRGIESGTFVGSSHDIWPAGADWALR